MGIDIIVSLCVAFIIVCVERRTALMIFLASVILIPSGDTMVLAGGHFFATRVLILGAIFRIFIRREYLNFRLNSIDRLFLLFVVTNFLIYVVRRGDTGALINRLGFAFNALGSYFFFRFNLRDYEDTRFVLNVLPIVLIILSFGMLIEFTTQFNPFKYLGAESYNAFRGEGVRCIASFGHPILAGTFGAISIPLVANQLTRNMGRTMGVLGIIAALAIVFFSHSSGPLLTMIAILLGFILWRYRENMRALRWAFLFLLLALHLTMKAPIWYLIGKISELVGGTGWHRSELINSFIVYFREWWFMGTDKTSHWLAAPIISDPNNVDVTNQYIRFALDGGLLTLILFIWLLVRCYRQIGTHRKSTEPSSMEGSFFYWTLGVSLAANNMAFFSVSYFDQIFVHFCFLISLIAKSTFDKTFIWTETDGHEICEPVRYG